MPHAGSAGATDARPPAPAPAPAARFVPTLPAQSPNEQQFGSSVGEEASAGLIEDDEEDLGVVEDTGRGLAGDSSSEEEGPDGAGLGPGSEDSEGEWEVGPRAVPRIFSTEVARRLFVVQSTSRAHRGCRPSFEFEGYIVEVGAGLLRDGGGSGDEVDSARGTQKLVDSGLTLSLRYEPPSPKFSRQCLDYTSYRLKLCKGPEFLYSVRGLQRQLHVNSKAFFVVWGNLELAFRSGGELANFLEALRYVDLTETALPKLVPPPATTSLSPRKGGPDARDGRSAKPAPRAGGAAAKGRPRSGARQAAVRRVEVGGGGSTWAAAGAAAGQFLWDNRWAIATCTSAVAATAAFVTWRHAKPARQ